MRDLIQGIFLIAGAYFASAAFAFVLFRIFFPLKTKAVMGDKLTVTYTTHKTIHASTNHKVRLISVGGRKGLAKANS